MIAGFFAAAVDVRRVVAAACVSHWRRYAAQ